MIFEVVNDFVAVPDAIPAEHPRYRNFTFVDAETGECLQIVNATFETTANSERAQQQAMAALQRLDNLSNAAWLSPSAHAALRNGNAMCTARQALRQAEQYLAQLHDEVGPQVESAGCC